MSYSSNCQLIGETLSKYQQHIDSVLLRSTTTAIGRWLILFLTFQLLDLAHERFFSICIEEGQVCCRRGRIVPINVRGWAPRFCQLKRSWNTKKWIWPKVWLWGTRFAFLSKTGVNIGCSWGAPNTHHLTNRFRRPRNLADTGCSSCVNVVDQAVSICCSRRRLWLYPEPCHGILFHIRRRAPRDRQHRALAQRHTIVSWTVVGQRCEALPYYSDWVV